jgi:hypothetical protein
MGYTTDFRGQVSISPPLNMDEISYLNDFAATRRMDREKGPFYVRGGGWAGQAREDDIRNYNMPDPSQPGLWCQWVVSDDGTRIEWDGGEKFYCSVEWMRYLIDTFLASPPDAATLAAMTAADPRLAEFTFDHVVNGVIDAQGEDPDDRWRLSVEDNIVKMLVPEYIWKEA